MAADEIHVELVGFLTVAPETGEGSSAVAVPARLEVPNEQGGPRVTFRVEVTSQTERRLPAGLTSGAGLVVVEGILDGDHVRALRLREIDVMEVSGRMLLPEGPLALPVGADRLVQMVLDGAPDVPVTFLITPRTVAAASRLRHGQRVTLGVAHGTRMVIGLETRD